MRHAAITFAEQVRQFDDEPFDILFASDMLNLAEFVGLVDERIRRLPKVIYFHENQLTYPSAGHVDESSRQRDYQYAFTNLTSALAADQVWFNSEFHRKDFLGQMRKFLSRMPDYQPLSSLDEIARKSKIHPPGVRRIQVAQVAAEQSATLRILWAARWEHDKNPCDFFSALRQLKKRGIDFRLVVLGQSFRDTPAIFETARLEFRDEIVHWGYVENADDYDSLVSSCDCIVSTANHEFFGIAAIEAMIAGVFPILPNRLAYPEVLRLLQVADVDEHLYDGSVEQLTKKLAQLAVKREQSRIRFEFQPAAVVWKTRAAAMDQALSDV